MPCAKIFLLEFRYLSVSQCARIRCLRGIVTAYIVATHALYFDTSPHRLEVIEVEVESFVHCIQCINMRRSVIPLIPNPLANNVSVPFFDERIVVFLAASAACLRNAGTLAFLKKIVIEKLTAGVRVAGLCFRGNLLLNVFNACKRSYFSLVPLRSPVRPHNGRIYAINRVYHVSLQEVAAVHHGIELPMSRRTVPPRTRVYFDALFDGGRRRCRYSFCTVFSDEIFDASLHLSQTHFLQQQGGCFSVSPLFKRFERGYIDRNL